MSEFRKVCCRKCRTDFTYLYVSGRPRKHCLDCKPRKGPRRRPSENAYAPRRAFSWGHLPSGWFISQAGNACRTIRGDVIAVFERGGYFWFNLPTRRHENPRVSEIRAEAANVLQALSWAERMAANLLKSFATR